MRVAPAIILNGPKTIDLGDSTQLYIRESIHPQMNVPDGLDIFSSIAANSMDVAFSRIRGYSSRILSLFSFLTSTSFPDILPVKCYDVTPSKKTGKFVQYNYGVPMDTVSARRINIDTLKTSIAKINALSEDYNNRIYRAMHWYKLAVQSRDYLDKFTSLWIGLETINPLLRDHFGLVVEYSKCTKCGHETNPTLNGIKHLFKESLSDTKPWKKIRDIRAGTMHGFRNFKDIMQELRTLVPILEKALDKGLCIIIGIPKQSRLKPLDLGHPRPAYYLSSAVVEGPDLNQLDKSMIPSIDLDFTLVGREYARQGHRFDSRISIDDRYRFKEIQHTLMIKETVGNGAGFSAESL